MAPVLTARSAGQEGMGEYGKLEASVIPVYVGGFSPMSFLFGVWASHPSTQPRPQPKTAQPSHLHLHRPAPTESHCILHSASSYDYYDACLSLISNLPTGRKTSQIPITAYIQHRPVLVFSTADVLFQPLRFCLIPYRFASWAQV